LISYLLILYHFSLTGNESIGFLALAFELMCRNIRIFIAANSVKGAAGTATAVQGSLGYEQYAPKPMRTTRRMNAWQQTQEAEDHWEQPRIGRSSRTSRIVDYTEY
jgi:hypothetical protein